MKNSEIGRQIAEINNLVHRLIQKTDGCCDNDEKAALSHSSACIIGYLSDHADENIFQRDLEREFNVRRSTMSKVLSQLEAKDYIARLDDKSDRRLKKIVLTQKASQLADKIKLQRLKLEEVLRGSISDDELLAFYKTCEKIKQNLSKEDNK